MGRILQFACPEAAEPGDIDVLICSLPGVSAGHREVVARSYLDTADRRLKRHGLVLQADARDGDVELSLRSLDGRRESGPFGNPTVPRRARDVVHSGLRHTLAETVGHRALRSWLVCPLNASHYRCLDENRKIFATVTLEQCFSDLHTVQAPIIASVTAKKGYSSEAKRFGRVIANAVTARPLKEDRALLLGDALGVRDTDFRSKPEIDLSPDERPERALADALLAYSAIMRANETGVCEGGDIEYLHDFRIAMRRTRSLLNAFDGFLGQHRLKRFRQDLAWLSTGTGSLRDLDVLALEIEKCLDREAEANATGVEALLDFVDTLRRAEYRKVRRMLESRRYAAFSTEWTARLEHLRESGRRRRKDRVLRKLTSRVIAKRHRTIVRAIRKGSALRSEEALHSLRKDCKKLRYLIEAFGALYPRKRLARVTSELKRLQDVLGRTCDGFVRQALLREWRAAAGRGEIDPNLVDALEFVVSHTAGREPSGALESTLSCFGQPETVALYTRLFGKGRK